MERSAKARPDALAAAMADGASIDWQAVDADTAGVSHADLIRQLRVIAAVRGREGPAAASRHHGLRLAVTTAFSAGVALAAVKVLVALAGLPAAVTRLSPSPQLLPFTINLLSFGVGGLLLLVGGGRDHRLQLLGGLYLTIASAFVEPFVSPGSGAFGAMWAALSLCEPEAFMGLGVWLFAWAFPQEPVTRRGRRVAGAAVVVALGAAVLMFAANIAREQQLWPASRSALPTALSALDRSSPKSLHWPLLFALALPAIPFLLAKGRRVSADDRRRVTWFVASLGLGFLPIVVAVIATPFVPAFREPDVRYRVGLGLYLALASIVPMTAYAVAVNRVMTLEFVIRATLQYALARYAIWALILAPVSYLALDVVVHRGLTFVQYLDVRGPAGLLGFSAFGLVVLAFRPQLVRAVDRWFLREPIDAPQALARLEQRFRSCEHLAALSAALGQELSAALHAERVTVLLLAEDCQSLVPLDGSARPLPRVSVLLELLQAARAEVHLDARSAVARLLPEPDQEWIHDTGAQLLSPLVGSSGVLLGLAAIGESVNHLPYTDSHVTLVTAMCGHAAMQIENRWLRQARALPPGRPITAAGAGVAWQDEPATWCPNCLATGSPETQRCRCGTATKTAVLPLFVHAKFRLRRVLGAGGTGVVYLATDLALDRDVALKTLPPMRREYAERLRREARAMASVRHPNLATIYGAEEWHDTPLLVVEYLEGGTLHDWLARGPMPIDQALDLGIMLADALDRVHGSGVLHRDIKPSNIGYTMDGVPKLLDFGLAAMLDRTQRADGAPATIPADPVELAIRFRDVQASSTLTITHQVVGTPLYLSPEALAGAAPHESFDLWSLNLVLYEAMAGGHPFAGRSVPDVVATIQCTPLPDLREARPDCPAAVASYLGDALSLSAPRRPGAAGDVRTALRALRARL